MEPEADATGQGSAACRERCVPGACHAAAHHGCSLVEASLLTWSACGKPYHPETAAGQAGWLAGGCFDSAWPCKLQLGWPPGWPALPGAHARCSTHLHSSMTMWMFWSSSYAPLKCTTLRPGRAWGIDGWGRGAAACGGKR